jgi:hypothetical protein
VPFVIGCEVHFVASAELEPLRIDHLLDFSDEGNIYKKYMKIKKNKLKKGVLHDVQERKRILKMQDRLFEIKQESLRL